MADTDQDREDALNSLRDHPAWKAFIAEVANDREVAMAANMEPVLEWYHGRYRGVVDHCDWCTQYIETELDKIKAEKKAKAAPDVALVADYEESEIV